MPTDKLLRDQDFLAGALFSAIGLFSLFVGMEYPFGSVQEMGPGFFPRILSIVLIAFGLFMAVRSLKTDGETVGEWGWRPLALLSLALFSFGWVMEELGLIPALVVMCVLSVLAGGMCSIRETLVLTVILCVLAVAIFVLGLGLPYVLVVGV
jgi:hypothetical protein